ncbi:hypothetical protein Syn7502_03098 [Synechococcus sp. PCC 7502]|uniref:hypothetical protein n=1 Tax=Synechococcus sp. PCC 7502 TaxID=1173263 RepID=UPI00029FCFCF|nr:hypothetical protein [Synechococcus sp. PCC 7502]AFY74996.1 hypothetical protein Syn7502_03098 [Synechococcus sp. PCC 7502]
MLISIDFELETPEVELGQVVTGNFIWQGSTARKSISVDIAIGWCTQGKGYQDQDTVCHQVFNEVEPDVIMPFAIALPLNAPPSYSGKLIKIMWKVTTTIYIQGFLGKFGNQKEEFSRPIKVLPYRVVP